MESKDDILQYVRDKINSEFEGVFRKRKKKKSEEQDVSTEAKSARIEPEELITLTDSFEKKEEKFVIPSHLGCSTGYGNSSDSLESPSHKKQMKNVSGRKTIDPVLEISDTDDQTYSVIKKKKKKHRSFDIISLDSDSQSGKIKQEYPIDWQAVAHFVESETWSTDTVNDSKSYSKKMKIKQCSDDKFLDQIFDISESDCSSTKKKRKKSRSNEEKSQDNWPLSESIEKHRKQEYPIDWQAVSEFVQSQDFSDPKSHISMRTESLECGDNSSEKSKRKRKHKKENQEEHAHETEGIVTDSLDNSQTTIIFDTNLNGESGSRNIKFEPQITPMKRKKSSKHSDSDLIQISTINSDKEGSISSVRNQNKSKSEKLNSDIQSSDESISTSIKNRILEAFPMSSTIISNDYQSINTFGERYLKTDLRYELIENSHADFIESTPEKPKNTTHIKKKHSRYYSIYNSDCEHSDKSISPKKYSNETLSVDYRTSSDYDAAGEENSLLEENMPPINNTIDEVRSRRKKVSTSINTTNNDSDYSDELVDPRKYIKKTLFNGQKNSNVESRCEMQQEIDSPRKNKSSCRSPISNNHNEKTNSFIEETDEEKSTEKIRTRKSLRYTKYLEPTESDRDLVKNLTIHLPFLVPPLHEIVSRNSRTNLLMGSDFNIKSGAFSKTEDEIIMNNWKQFCEVHNLDVKPAAFFLLGGMKGIERKKFLQYISHGLEDRLPMRVHARFKKIYENMAIKKGRFSEEEDKVILRFMSKYGDADYPFLQLSKILNRSNIAVLKRYEILTNANNHEKIVWTQDLAEKLVRRMMRVGKCSKFEDLENLELSTAQWHKLSRKMDNMPLKKLQRGWKVTVHPRLFSKNDLLEVKRKILTILSERKATDWRTVDWQEIASHFHGYTPQKVYNLIKTLVVFHVPRSKQGNLEESLRILNNTKIWKVKKLRKFVFKEGHLKYEDCSEDEEFKV